MKQIEQEFIRNIIPIRKENSYKGNYGRVLLIGGNKDMGGAIIMAASAAVYSGAGLVTVATSPANHSALHARLPEAMVVDWGNERKLVKQVESADVVVIGPGLGLSSKSLSILKTVLSTVTKGQYLIVDGSGISLMAQNHLKTPKANTIYTPHLGEWEKLSGIKPDEQQEKLNKEACKELGATVVLKQHRTEIYYKEESWKNSAGNPGMATGGMGDTLAGMIAAFVAQLPHYQEAILAAVYVHSWIGDQLAEDRYVVLPTHIIERIPQAMKEFSKSNSH